jgi:putative polyketide hydroxylase
MEIVKLPRKCPQVPVLVVGAGPAGLVAGITLAGYGIGVLVVDKRDEIAPLSRALVISTRGMELMRRWGLEDAVRAGAPEVIPRAWVTQDLACGEGAEMPLGYPSDEEAAAVSPCRPAWAPQDHHEPLLLAHLRQLPGATVRFGCELTALSQDRAGVHAVLLDHRTAASSQVGAQYVIAADGAHSRVREQLGIGMAGPDHLADYERAEFSAPLAAVAGDRRYALYVITRPDAAGVLGQRGRGDRWGISRERAGGQPRFARMREDELTSLITRAAGVSDLPVRMERLSSFSFAAQIAGRYRRGRGFLTGDAAHRMTPRGGTGMNTAIQDSFDLGWKLAWVLRGWAPPSLLDTYQAERRPVGLHNVQRAAQPAGARAAASEAVPWDLNGRLAHHWIRTPGRPVSTLDLIGDGLTLLTGPGDPRWKDASADYPGRVPVGIHSLGAATADALRLAPGGAVLVRPDGREVGRWPSYGAWRSAASEGGLAAAGLSGSQASRTAATASISTS